MPTDRSALAHSAVAAPMYVNADTATPTSNPPPVGGLDRGQERWHGADVRVGHVDQPDEQDQLNDLVAGEPGDGLGLDLIGTCLAHHLLPRRRDDGARIADRLPEAAWQSGFREPTRCREDRVFAEMGDG